MFIRWSPFPALSAAIASSQSASFTYFSNAENAASAWLSSENAYFRPNIDSLCH
jgi:hypothetical protein